MTKSTTLAVCSIALLLSTAVRAGDQPNKKPEESKRPELTSSPSPRNTTVDTTAAPQDTNPHSPVVFQSTLKQVQDGVEQVQEDVEKVAKDVTAIRSAVIGADSSLGRTERNASLILSCLQHNSIALDKNFSSLQAQYAVQAELGRGVNQYNIPTHRNVAQLIAASATALQEDFQKSSAPATSASTSQEQSSVLAANTKAAIVTPKQQQRKYSDTTMGMIKEARDRLNNMINNNDLPDEKAQSNSSSSSLSSSSTSASSSSASASSSSTASSGWGDKLRSGLQYVGSGLATSSSNDKTPKSSSTTRTPSQGNNKPQGQQ